MWRRLEHYCGRFAVPNLTLVLIALQIVVFAAMIFQGDKLRESLVLAPGAVLDGELWRLLTFLAVPPSFGIIFTLIFWYIFYFMGTSLERNWGVFHYNVYVLIWYLAVVATSFLTPEPPPIPWTVTLETSVLLAFAYLFPNLEFLIFFILPVKAKWIGILTWILIGVQLFTTLGARQWGQAIQLAAVFSSFYLFFGYELFERLAWGQRRLAHQAERQRREKAKPKWNHRCRVCGKTDVSDPDEEFRYCSRCIGQQAYCSEHLRDHEHVVENDPVA